MAVSPVASRRGNWESNQASNQAGIMGLDNNGSKSRLSNRCVVKEDLEHILFHCPLQQPFDKKWCWLGGAHGSHLSVLRPVIEGGDVCWRKQTIGMIKCNVDEATFVDSGQMGWDAIVHNDAGGFVRCISGSMKSGCNPSMIEILAVREDVS
ncbi:hypothetical protein Gogos_015547 [Gossypium gossypioides]|uniref:Uncharacterized protein n=1 Tax=Gossypium gossypioides TaxID=34282 RepID=A0A7J9C241_GOSGO|nr:hypothetical protein [Gossypium gossypioides]